LIYTRRGDRLETDLLRGARVFKDDARVETLGAIDELSSVLGVVRCVVADRDMEEDITGLQRLLRTIAGELAEPGVGHTGEDASVVAGMEKEIDRLEETLFPQAGFVLPGPPPGAAWLHVARAVARRAERSLVALARRETVNAYVLQYVNRLSDYLFLLARRLEQRELVHLVALKVKQALTNQSHSLKGVNGLMTLAKARQMMEGAEKEAAKLGVPVVVAVVDAGGNLVGLSRMDGALLVSLDLAVNKAYSAVAVRLPTDELARLAQPGQDLYGIDKADGGRIVIFGGGLPVFDGERLIGGLGVSGGTVQQDVTIAGAGVRSLAQVR